MSVQIEVDELILPEIDLLARQSDKTRYDVINEILRKGVHRMSIEEKIEQYRKSYLEFPVQPDEFDVDEDQLIEAWKDL